MKVPTGKQIQTLGEFKSIISKGEGFIVITDNATDSPTRIHYATCHHFREDWFFEKMVENEGKYGLYLWYSSIAEAQNAIPDRENCKFCNA